MRFEPWIEHDKRRGTCVVRWRDESGAKCRDEYTYDNKSDAKARKDIVRDLLKNRSLGIVDDTRTILECADKFKESTRGEVTDGRIDNGYQSSLNLFATICNGMSPSVRLMRQVRRKVILEFKSEMYKRKMSEHSIRLYLGVISVWLKWAKTHEWIQDNPFIDIGLPVPKQIDRFLTDAQLLSIEKKIVHPTFRCIFRIGYDVGLRPGEIRGIQPDHLTWHPEKGVWVLSIPPDNNKTSTGRMVVVPLGIVELMPRTYKVSPFEKWSARRIGRHFALALKAAEIPDKVLRNGRKVDIIFYWTRHTYARRMLEKGMDLGILMVLMGHSSIKMTKDTYGHLERSFILDQASLINQLPNKLGADLIGICGATAGQTSENTDTYRNSMVYNETSKQAIS